jgi:polysaccharide biosynthesis/export protein
MLTPLRRRSAGRRLGALFVTLPAALALFLAASPTAAQTASATAVAPLEPGDAIRLAFWREPALSGEYPVDETGVVVLPYVGVRDVTSLSPAALRERLLEDYSGVLENQGVHVTLLRRVRILGAVRTPGLYHVDGTMTLADALALAGGLLPTGRLDRVRVVRGGEVIPIDLSSDLPADRLLRSGDQITVPESGWISRNSAALLGATISALGFLLGQAIF